MKTETVFAYQVENNDHIVKDGEVMGYVYSKDDTEDAMVFDVVDDEGDHTLMPFGPFESVTIVTSFYDDSTDEEVISLDL